MTLIQLGKTYTTRSCDKVTITNVDYSYSMPFFGCITTQEGKHIRVASFNAAGMYCNNKQTSFDIIATA